MKMYVLILLALLALWPTQGQATPEGRYLVRLDTPAAQMLEAQLERSAELDEIGWAVVTGKAEGLEPDPQAEAFESVNDPLAAQQWSLDRMAVPAAWGQSHGDGAVVAVVDTGVDAGHVDLLGKVLGGYDFANNDSDASDDHGHGTHVAGIACAATNNGFGVAGVGYNCKVLPVKVLSVSGYGYHSWIASGIVYAVQHGAQVVNMSLGGYSSSGVLQDAVRYAQERGVLVVAAAGNDGGYTDNYPAAYPEVLSVCASDTADRVANFSNRAESVDVCAPGVSVLSTVRGNGYQAWNGTSMASPNAAGVGALLAAAGFKGDAARARILSGADDIGGGWGRVNAARALGNAPGPTMTPAPNRTATPTKTPVVKPSVTPRATATPGNGCLVSIGGLTSYQARQLGYALALAGLPFQQGTYNVTFGRSDKVTCK